jgi:hypothetical protein
MPARLASCRRVGQGDGAALSARHVPQRPAAWTDGREPTAGGMKRAAARAIERAGCSHAWYAHELRMDGHRARAGRHAPRNYSILPCRRGPRRRALPLSADAAHEQRSGGDHQRAAHRGALHNGKRRRAGGRAARKGQSWRRAPPPTAGPAVGAAGVGRVHAALFGREVSASVHSRVAASDRGSRCAAAGARRLIAARAQMCAHGETAHARPPAAPAGREACAAPRRRGAAKWRPAAAPGTGAVTPQVITRRRPLPAGARGQAGSAESAPRKLVAAACAPSGGAAAAGRSLPGLASAHGGAYARARAWRRTAACKAAPCGGERQRRS